MSLWSFCIYLWCFWVSVVIFLLAVVSLGQFLVIMCFLQVILGHFSLSLQINLSLPVFLLILFVISHFASLHSAILCGCFAFLGVQFVSLSVTFSNFKARGPRDQAVPGYTCLCPADSFGNQSMTILLFSLTILTQTQRQKNTSL